MPIAVDTTRAPAILTYVATDPWPRPVEHRTSRQRLIDDGHLTAETVLVLDIRAVRALPALDVIRGMAADASGSGLLPRAVAFLVERPEQYGVARQAQSLMSGTIASQVFTGEAEAWAWVDSLPRPV